MHDTFKIRVFTKDNIELDKCHNSRARQLLKKEEAKLIIKDNEKYLQLNKTKEMIMNSKEIS